MNLKMVFGSAAAVALVGLGVLAGSVAGTGSAGAQTASATPTVTAQTTPSTPGTTTPPVDGLRGMKGRGHGGFAIGHLGQGATAENATRQITNTTEIIALVKSDLAYATGKMDTANVQKWIDGADELLKSAQSANSSSQYGQAIAYAEAARQLALTADQQMAQELGASTLPSYNQLPLRRGMHDTAGTTTVTQAQASWVLANSYNRLVAEATQVSSASNASTATPYLTDAQNAYRAAYSAYQAGNYTDAVESARLAEKLAHVADAIARASSAPANADTPVTVPAPNF
jgi:hypothetical protein